MTRLLPVLFVLVLVAPLLAEDDGGDGTHMPSYQELVREGYGPRGMYGDGGGYYQRLNYWYHAAPKPTQAYYGRGYTIYYGYTMVRVAPGEEDTTYAFGYPLSYFRKLMPETINATNISDYAVEVRKNGYYQPGDYVAQGGRRGNAVTTVQKVAVQAKAPAASPSASPAARTATAPAAATLPPIAEKPSSQ